MVDGDVVAPFGDVRIEGEVIGDVTVGHGNLVLADGAIIHGNAVVNGGGRRGNGRRGGGPLRAEGGRGGQRHRQRRKLQDISAHGSSPQPGS